jgi:hypothetical protein
MMRNVHHTRSLAFEIAQANADMRELIGSSLEILKTPIPDTFLGRKTQEPFPVERKARAPLRSSPAVNKVPEALQDNRPRPRHAPLQLHPPHARHREH